MGDSPTSVGSGSGAPLSPPTLPNAASWMTGTAHAVRPYADPSTPLLLGKSAPGTSYYTMKNAKNIKPRSVSGVLPRDEDRDKSAKRSVDFWAYTLRLGYDYEEAEEILKKFIICLPEKPQTIYQRHSAPARLLVLNPSVKGLAISVQGRKIVLNGPSTEMVCKFDLGKYLEHVTTMFEFEKGNASSLLIELDDKVKTARTEELEAYYKSLVTTFEKLAEMQRRSKEFRDAFFTLGETKAQTAERKAKERDADRIKQEKIQNLIESARNKATFEKEKADEKIVELNEASIKFVKSFYNDVIANIRAREAAAAPAGAGAGTYGGLRRTRRRTRRKRVTHKKRRHLKK